MCRWNTALRARKLLCWAATRHRKLQCGRHDTHEGKGSAETCTAEVGQQRNHRPCAHSFVCACVCVASSALRMLKVSATSAAPAPVRAGGPVQGQCRPLFFLTFKGGRTISNCFRACFCEYQGEVSAWPELMTIHRIWFDYSSCRGRWRHPEQLEASRAAGSAFPGA